MKHPRTWIPFPILVGVLGVLVPAARAQTYGPDAQVLTIGAAQFQAMSPLNGYIDSDGYLYYSGDLDQLAPLSLPEGATIEKVCLYANDSDPGKFGYVRAVLIAGKLVPGGEGPHVTAIPGAIAISTSDVGYGYYCSPPLSYTVRGKTDVDGDEILDAVAYSVLAYVPLASQNSLGLGGVQITWKRPVSTPPSTPTFGDVPATDLAFPFIEALAASGITAGCAGGNYCPDATLTRRQMAVFLSKALGLHWPF